MFPVLSFLNSKSFVAIDMHPESISLAQLKRSKQLTITKLATQALCNGAIVDGKIQNSAMIKQALDRLIANENLKGLSVVMTLPSNGVISKLIKVSSFLRPSEWRLEVQSRLDYYLPEASEEIVFDLIELTTLGDFKELLLIAIRKVQVIAYCDILNASGLHLKSIEINCHALIRIINRFLPIQFAASWIVLIERRSRETLILFFKRSAIYFYKQFVVESEQHFIASIHKLRQFYFSQDQVEELRYFCIGDYFSNENKLQCEKELQINFQILNINSYFKMDTNVNCNPRNWDHYYASLGCALRGDACLK